MYYVCVYISGFLEYMHNTLSLSQYVYIYTYLIVIGKVTVGDSNARGALNGIDEAITAIPHGNMIDPHIL